MAKIRKVSLGNMPAEPGEMGGGNFYDGPVPPPGLYKGNLKRLSLKTNKNGDYMVNGLIEINEPSKSSKSKFNGYGIWFNQNVTEQGAPYLANFLKAIGSTYKAFIADGGLQVDDAEPPNIVKIGTKRITEEITVSVVTKNGIYNGQEKLDVTRFVSAKEEDGDDDDMEVEEAEEDEADEDLDEDDEDEDSEDDDDEDEDEDSEDDDAEDEDEDEGEAYTREELEEMSIAALRTILRSDYGWTASDYKDMSKDDIIDSLMGDGDEDEDDEPLF